MRVITRSIKEEITPLEYLMIWVGLVGAAVGLTLPKEMVAKKLASTKEHHEL
jgi:hypothetical protein